MTMLFNKLQNLSSILSQPVYKRCIIAVALIIPSSMHIIDNAAPTAEQKNSYKQLLQVPTTEWENSVYFNTQFLANYTEVKTMLLEQESFKELYFPSADNISLNGLARIKENAPYSIILCSGFYPGRKEGIATFVKMIDPNANMLFFDARGHGTSDGKFITNLFNYGCDEYKDVIGAIEWMSKQSSAPLIIYGLCAGSFHATRALAHCTAYRPDLIKNVCGLIIDSGFDSLARSCRIPAEHFKDKILPALLLKYYTQDTKQTVRDRYLYTLSSAIVTQLLKPFAWITQSRMEKSTELTLHNIIGKITCPILFIHAKNDDYSPYEDIIQLNELAQNSQLWFIEDSEHAVHHLKHKYEYYKQMSAFIENALNLKTNL